MEFGARGRLPPAGVFFHHLRIFASAVTLIFSGCSEAVLQWESLSGLLNSNALQISPSTVSVPDSANYTFSASGGETPYTYSVVSGGGSIVAATGVFTAPVAPATVTVRVTDNAGTTSDATVTITNVPSTGTSSIVGSGPITADGSSTSTVTITLLDAGSAAVVGVIPTFSATDTGTTNSYGTCSASDASGVSTCTLSSTVAEIKTLNLDTPISMAGGSVTFQAGTADATNSTISATSSITADGSATSTVTITLIDANSNPLVGVTPAYSASGTGNTFPGACTATNASGISTCTMASTVAESKTLQITSPIIDPGTTNTTFIPGAAAKVVFTTEPSTTATAGTNFTTQPVVQVQDTSGNLIASSSDPITLGAYTDATCTTAAGGTFNVTPNPLNASSGIASFSGINYESTGIIYIRASSGALTTDCSVAITVSPATSSKLVFSTDPSATGTAGAAFATQPVVQIQDTYNNIVTSAADTITLTAFTDATCTTASAGTFNHTPTAAVSGVATFSGVNHEKAESLYIKASSGALTTDCSTLVTVSAGTAITLTYQTQPSSTASASAAFATQPVVGIYDNFGNLTTNTDSITLAAFTDASCTTAAGGTLGATTNPLAATSGVATFAGVNYDTSETIYIEATAGGLTSACSNGVTIGAGAATKLVFSTEPSGTATAGTNFTTQPVVEIQDASNNVVTAATDTVTLTAFTDSSCTVTSSGTFNSTATAASAGIATFSGVNHQKAETLYIKASSGALTTDCSTLVTVSANSPSTLAFSTQPSATGTAGTDLATQPFVEIRDNYGNLTSATDSITLAAFTNATCTTAAAGTFNVATNPLAASAGVATFSGVNYNIAETIYIKASSGGYTTDCSTAVVISPGTATKLVFSTEPSATATAGTNFTTQPVVEIQDASNNLVTSASDTITLSAFTDTTCTTASTGTFNSTATAASSGVATFSGVNHEKAEVVYIKATSGALTTDCSTIVTVSAGSAAELVFATQPSGTAIVSTNFTTQPVVEVQDGFGNIVVSVASITLTPYSDAACGSPPTGSLSATANPVAAVAGTATFAGVQHDTAETIYIQASSGALTAACSTAVVVSASAGPPTKLVFSTQPSGTGTAGTNLTVQPTVEIQDAGSSVVTSATDTVTLTAFTDSGCTTAALGTLNATTNPLAATSGVATFSGLNYEKAETIYLQASSGALTTACSTAIVVSAGAADYYVIVQGDAQSATVHTNVATEPQVRVVDQFGNAVSGATVSFTPSNDGVVGNTTNVSDATGLAVAGSWTLAAALTNTLSVGPALPDVAATGNGTLSFSATGTATDFVDGAEPTERLMYPTPSLSATQFSGTGEAGKVIGTTSYTNLPIFNTCQILETPPLQILYDGTSAFSFRGLTDLEYSAGNYDWFIVQISTEGGGYADWDNTPFSAWENSTPLDNQCGTFVTPTNVIGGIARDGNVDIVTDGESFGPIDLTGYAGQKVKIRFVFSQDYAVQSSLYLDSITVSDVVPLPTPTLSITSVSVPMENTYPGESSGYLGTFQIGVTGAEHATLKGVEIQSSGSLDPKIYLSKVRIVLGHTSVPSDPYFTFANDQSFSGASSTTGMLEGLVGLRADGENYLHVFAAVSNSTPPGDDFSARVANIQGGTVGTGIPSALSGGMMVQVFGGCTAAQNSATWPSLEKDLSGRYIICNEIQYTAMSNDSSGWGNNYVLYASIDLTSFLIGVIGINPNPFTGSFDGNASNGLVIANPAVSGTTQVGMFGVTSGARLHDIAVESPTVTGSGDHVGGLVGWAGSGTMITKIAVKNANVTGQRNVGGVIGILDDDAVIASCSSSGIVNPNSDGGGGLIGKTQGGDVYYSYSTATLNGNTSAAGIYYGGLIGYAGFGSTIMHAYSTGSVTGRDYIGGLIGMLSTGVSDPETAVYDSFSTGAVTATGPTPYEGGFLGVNDESSILNAYWDATLSGSVVPCGGATAGEVGCTTADGTQTGSYFYNPANAPMWSWDFTNIWNSNNPVDYPSLR